jgi:hypothetical protein
VTRKIPFTQASLRRAIEAARKVGSRVTGIRPDGTLVVDDHSNPQSDAKSDVERDQEIVL